MRAAPDARALLSLVREARSVVIGSHVDPDGDAIGSTLALTRALRSLGCTCVPVLADGASVPPTYAFLPGSDLFRRADELSAPDVFIMLDTSDLARLGDATPLAEAANTRVVIDHHPCTEGGDLRIVDVTAAATAELVRELIGVLGIELDREIATCLYTGLVTDTGRFSYSNTTSRALRLAAELVESGVDVVEVYTAVYENRSAAALALTGRALSRITVVNDGRVAYSWITDADLEETGAQPSETENLIDVVRAVGSVEAVALFRVRAEEVRVSLRAKADADVGSVARALGGGGHRAAAGCTVTGDLARALGTVLPLLPGGP